MSFDLEKLLDCSDTMLHDIALARMDRAANLRKMLREMLDEVVDELLFERMCRFAVDNRAWLTAKREQLQLPLMAPKKPPTSVRVRRKQNAA